MTIKEEINAINRHSEKIAAIATEVLELSDECGNISICECEVGATRVVRILSQKPLKDEPRQHLDAAYLNDVRFGESQGDF